MCSVAFTRGHIYKRIQEINLQHVFEDFTFEIATYPREPIKRISG